MSSNKHFIHLPVSEGKKVKHVHICGHIYVYLWASLVGLAGKESACSEGDLGSIPGLGRSPGEGKGFPLKYSGLENSMD